MPTGECPGLFMQDVLPHFIFGWFRTIHSNGLGELVVLFTCISMMQCDFQWLRSASCLNQGFYMQFLLFLSAEVELGESLCS